MILDQQELSILIVNRQLLIYIQFIQRMQFLKQKVKTIFDSSKNIMKKKERNGLNGKETLLLLLKKSDEQQNSFLYLQLIKLSLEFHEYTQIFNILIDRLGDFQYKSASVKQFLKLLDISCHLVKSGNAQFVNDFKKNQDVLIKIEKINTHFYQNTYKSNAKQLTYNLELIRHRAIYLRKLINNSQLLEEEQMITKERDIIIEELMIRGQGGDQTINGLKIQGLDKSPPKNELKEIPIQMIMQQQNLPDLQTEQRSQFEIIQPKSNQKPSMTQSNKISNYRNA